ncbi:AMIN domain-containing protein [Desulfovibrio gilichinskyi]|uniref:AMIN domain-containing protein n=1 Tax=Desulfovibrio gilichinskyi TaxID=1519643 RepID=A0A1X7C334_9BACT|nr:AMIN domain-containing protein [Desulfovibrio gilichinskyi]SME89164.1 AMIN domain-containing protein [Desulfovibrio gilichinskyi]
MPVKNKKIIQCPFCNSNRLYLRRGLVSDAFISLLTSVRSFTCGSCSRSFRKYNNYFTSKQALVHILIILAIVAIANPDLINPKNWLMQEQVAAVQETPATGQLSSEADPEELLVNNETIAIATAVNGTSELNATSTYQPEIIDNATEIEVVNGTANGTAGASQENATVTEVGFNATEINVAAVKNPVKTGLQGGRLNSIYFKNIDKKTRINLDMGGSPLSYTSFFLRNPDRLVVDVIGKWEYFGPTTLRPENPIFSRFRIGIYENKLRMVMDLKGNTPAPTISKTDTGLNIDVK